MHFILLTPSKYQRDLIIYQKPPSMLNIGAFVLGAPQSGDRHTTSLLIHHSTQELAFLNG